MELYGGGGECIAPPFLTSAPDGDALLDSRSARFIPF
jgi:hypothetical protein